MPAAFGFLLFPAFPIFRTPAFPINLPNTITLARIPAMFVIVGLMYCDWIGAASLALLVFIAAAIGDWLDGHLARKRGLVTTFGKLMDALTDKIMVVGLVIGFVGKLEIPVWLALITLCREFLVTGLRMVAATRGVIVSADRGGKSKTVTQLIALGFLLGAPMVARDWAWLLPTWHFDGFAAVVHRIGFYIFVLGTVLAVWSGWRYIAQHRDVVFSEADR
jgi:CDP-diacylglycerol--glycerol-3-phosphate 3-phosphatidyltransferase